MNTGGFLLLTVIFSILLILIQRTEQKRRWITGTVLFLVGVVVWNYARYRMYIDCNELFTIVCRSRWHQQFTETIAYNTLWRALFAALAFNGLFWIVLGRSNPPGTSDSIQVFGAKDLETPLPPPKPAGAAPDRRIVRAGSAKERSASAAQDASQGVARSATDEPLNTP